METNKDTELEKLRKALEKSRKSEKSLKGKLKRAQAKGKESSSKGLKKKLLAKKDLIGQILNPSEKQLKELSEKCPDIDFQSLLQDLLS
mgnify:FL=1